MKESKILFFSLISNSLFANIGKKNKCRYCFYAYLTQAHLILFYVFTEQCKPHLSGRITTFGCILFYFFSLFYSIKAP